MEGMEMIKKSEELEFLLDIQEHDRRTFWFKPLPWGCRMSLFFVLLTMEVYSAHGWRDLFFIGKQKSMRRRIKKTKGFSPWMIPERGNI